MRYDFLSVIGRFQPFHLGHKRIIESALGQSRHVIVLVGSPNVARSFRNPFTHEERIGMIRSVFPDESKSARLIVMAIDDHLYNETAWIAEVKRAVSRGMPQNLHGAREIRIGLAGLNKDSLSYYQKMFPEWEIFDCSGSLGVFNSTKIREAYFRQADAFPRDNCPSQVIEFLDRFRLGPEFQSLLAEADWMRAYRKSWAVAPFPPVFVTVDCLVQQSGHVLLVRRREQPGKGLLALPGGFIKESERLAEAAIRELREETQISDARGLLSPETLASFNSDSATRVFDAPERSIRGRTITHVFMFQCPERPQLFDVKGGDDAADASWHRLGELDPRQFFEDHWFILQAMTGI
jgi:bifunctional NMN adenylyltransferase/nudix hydrolase